MWQPDGAGSLAKIGVLTPHLDPVPETELQTMAPPGVSIHAARVPLGMVGPDGKIIARIGPQVAKAFAEPPAVDQAVASLSPLEPKAIIYAFTSSSYILGSGNDSLLQARLEKKSNGIPLIIQTAAVVSALQAIAAQRIALIHPPWYTPELDQLGAAYFTKAGVKVIHHGPALIKSDYGDILPELIHDWAKAHVPDTADALVFGGGGFRVIGAIDALETALNRPVLSANQASLWYALKVAGVSDRVIGYGRLFTAGTAHKMPGMVSQAD